MDGRDHSLTCEKCGAQRGGMNDDRCYCDTALEDVAKGVEIWTAGLQEGAEFGVPELTELLRLCDLAEAEDDAEEHCCVECSAWVACPPDLEATALCNPCAQAVLPQIAAGVRALIIQIAKITLERDAARGQISTTSVTS